MKNKSYVDKHGIVTGDPLSVRNIIIDRFFGDSMDDVADILVAKPYLIAFLQELKQKVNTMAEEMDQIRNKIILPAVTQYVFL